MRETNTSTSQKFLQSSSFKALATGFALSVMTFAASTSFTLQTGLAETSAPQANQSVQVHLPEAFALQPESYDFMREISDKNKQDEFKLIDAIRSNVGLKRNIAQFGTLSWADQKATLEAIFELQVEVAGVQAPELVFDDERAPGGAYFDFELFTSSPGTVVLAPSKLKDADNPHLAVLLLIHETRHSVQLQRAFYESLAGAPCPIPDTLPDGCPEEIDLTGALGFKAAFMAQKNFGKEELGDSGWTFADFLTLNNEYEAFAFANYVVGSLTNWSASTDGLGTGGSRFQKGGVPEIDILNIFERIISGNLQGTVLEEFNRQQAELP